MKESLHSVIQFIKENPAILYSILLIVIVPVFLFGFTFFLINNVQSSLDKEFKNKAFLTLSVLDAFSNQELENSEALKAKAERLTQRSSTLRSVNFSVYNESTETFEIIASSRSEQNGELLKEGDRDGTRWRRHKLALGTDNIIGAVITPTEGSRYWVALKRLENRPGGQDMVAQISLSLAQADARIANLRQISIYALIGLTLLLVLLVANHARLFEYAKLFREQKQIDKAKDEFISIASHELKTPITGITNFLQLVEDGDYGEIPEELQEALHSVRLRADNLQKLVKDLLDVSRIQQGRLELEFGQVSVNEVIREVVETYAQQASAKDLELKTDLGDSLPPLKLDRGRFQEVISNLVSNAVKYTEDGWVEVRSKVDKIDKQIIIEVEDTGIGMSAMEREKLFQKFYRIQAREASDVGGSGLGLWITKQLVEMMNGQIYVESIKGKGTRFSLLFSIEE